MSESTLVMNGDHTKEINNRAADEGNESDDEIEPDVHFEPIVNLPLVDVSNNEEGEEELIKLRAKLFRYDSGEYPAAWKERGTGEVKLLRDTAKHCVRVVMRRDKTLKICANHFITPWMELKPHCGSDRAWIWSVLADFADEEAKPELLAIRFANAENSQMWKEAFDKAKHIVGTECELYAGKPEDSKEDSDSESSDLSYVSSDTENYKSESKAKEKTAVDDKSGAKEDNNSTKAATDKITEELEKLDVQGEGKNK